MQATTSTSPLPFSFPAKKLPSPSLSFPPLSRHHHSPLLSSRQNNFSITLTPQKTNGPFIAPETPRKLKTLENFSYDRKLDHGSLRIRPMHDHELDTTVDLLAGSFAESMGLPTQYVHLLAYLVKQYVVERRQLVPHMTVLVGLYEEGDCVGVSGGGVIACAAEISFDAVGANKAPPTPTPPLECPYICNMTVKKELRRKQIGTHLLKACEELVNKMKAERRVYLHCRVVDKIPFKMYKKAGYEVVKTDSILVWLSLQRRKYLMCKELEPVPDQSDSSISDNHTD